MLAPQRPVNNLVPQPPQPIVHVTPSPTSIICGSGLTTSAGAYYIDCCGNSKSNIPVNTIVLLIIHNRLMVLLNYLAPQQFYV